MAFCHLITDHGLSALHTLKRLQTLGLQGLRKWPSHFFSSLSLPLSLVGGHGVVLSEYTGEGSMAGCAPQGMAPCSDWLLSPRWI